MTDLIERLEAGTADQEAELLWEVLAHAKEQSWIDTEANDLACEWVYTGACVCAALELVPDNCGWQIESYGTASIHSLKRRPGIIGFLITGGGEAATPALAIAIAAVRAWESKL